MNRQELNFVLNFNHYLRGGTKEACVKARDFLVHSADLLMLIKFSESQISIDEFIDAVKTLLAYASQQDDTIPKTWYCDNDCSRCSDFFCPGECSLDGDSKNLCPYFSDEALK